MLKQADVKRLTRRMDRIANDLQANPGKYGLTQKAAYAYAMDLDVASDELEAMVGLRDADVVDHDHDEDYMPTYDEAGPVDNQMDADEPYMQHFRDDTYDQLLDDAELTPGNHSGRGDNANSEVDASGTPWWAVDDSNWRSW